jgi:predicted CoA-substrate-specific enzyme activase
VSEGWALGVDIGSVTIKFLLLDEQDQVRYHSYDRTEGALIDALMNGLTRVRKQVPEGVSISATGTTGSGRFVAGALLGADLVKNEITTHAVGTLQWRQDIRTIIEIGGQDSKIIHLSDGMVEDFGMNTVCAAGTGAFLDQQANRLRIPIDEFGAFALTSRKPLRIAGRCSVFAESDMIHYQQAGRKREDICMGLCQALVRNYLNNVGRGRAIASPVSFQGGVAHNEAILHCFREALPDCDVRSPSFPTARGALGAAVLARRALQGGETRFRGWLDGAHEVDQHECEMCENECEISSLMSGGCVIARWGGRCDTGNSIDGQSWT